MKQDIPQPLNGLLAAGGALSIIIAWQFLLPFAGVPSYILPTPVEIARIFSKESALLWNNFWPTVYEAVMGFLLGNGMAILLAVIFVLNRYIQAAYFPVILFLNTIPILALAPVIVLIFGLGVLPKIIIAAVICFFPTLVNMIRGWNLPVPTSLSCSAYCPPPGSKPCGSSGCPGQCRSCSHRSGYPRQLRSLARWSANGSGPTGGSAP
jgi:ABC-type nitrate/sulfonate/bicarbonate transport system permease component